MRNCVKPMIMSVGMAVALAACHTGVCTDNQNSIPCAAFYSGQTGAAISVSDLSIGGIGAPHDSLLYTAGTTLSTVYLPLRAGSDVTSFRFHFTYDDVTDEETGDTVIDDTHDDIITFHYASTPYFAGEDCGAMYHFYIDRVDFTTNYIERVVVDDPFVTNTDAKRISIYFRTQEPDDDSGNPGDDGGEGGDEGEGAGADDGGDSGGDSGTDAGEGGEP